MATGNAPRLPAVCLLPTSPSVTLVLVAEGEGEAADVDAAAPSHAVRHGTQIDFSSVV